MYFICSDILGASLAPKKFFEERLDQSEVKARIVRKYFSVWSRVVRGAANRGDKRLAYIDLYAGPGRYKDGAASTPLLVLSDALKDDELCKMLVTIFNDANSNFSNTLKDEIEKLEGIEKLAHKPQIKNVVVDTEIAEAFKAISLVPTFSFFDPFGYKGLSLGLIHAFIKNWGCDTVFFFNYNRINAGIPNDAVEQHMASLFGAEKLPHLRSRLAGAKPSQREAIIIEEIALGLKELGGNFVLPFRFMNEAGTRLSHCLIFVSKHVKGYKIMKEIMAKESSTSDQGVPSFAYSPANAATPFLFSLVQPLNTLKGLLLEEFKGQTLTMDEVYERHHIGKNFIEINYKDALRELEETGKIVCNPAAADRRKIKGKVTFANHVIVQFPN